MKHALRISALSLVAAVVVTGIVSAIQIYALGRFEEKWGTRADNLILVLQLALLTAAAQAVLLFLMLLLPPARAAAPDGLTALAAIAVFAALTAWWFPPHSRHFLLMGIAIPLLTFLALLTTAHLRGPKAVPPARQEESAR